MHTKTYDNARRSLADRKASVVRPTVMHYAWWSDDKPWREIPRGSGRFDKRRSAKAERKHAKRVAWSDTDD